MRRGEQRLAGAVEPVEILQEVHRQLSATSPVALEAAHDADQLALHRLGRQARRGSRGVGDAEEVEHHREGVVQAGRGQQQPARDLLAGRVVAVLLRDAERVPHELHPRQEGDVLPVRDRVGLDDADAAGAASFGELVAEPALAHPGLGHDGDRLPAAPERALEGRLERGHLDRASDEAREAARAGDVEAGPQPARTLQLVEPQRLARALHARRPEVAQGEEPRDQLRGALGQEGPAGLGQLLHPLREPHRVALRRVVHAEVVADLADHHLARVEAHADGEADAARGPQLVRVASDLVTEMERRPARALGVVLVRDRRPEERHDAVAGVLVHRALEAVHALGQQLEEAVHDPVPLFGIELLRQLHRALHVGEEHRHLLALAFERVACAEDLLGEVSRGVRARIGLPGRDEREPAPALTAELDARRVLEAAARTAERGAAHGAHEPGGFSRPQAAQRATARGSSPA